MTTVESPGAIGPVGHRGARVDITQRQALAVNGWFGVLVLLACGVGIWQAIAHAPAWVVLPILAFVRLRYPHGNYKPFHDLVEATPEILEAHHVTGDDCFVIKVAARSMRHLEQVSGRIGALGSVTTSVVRPRASSSTSTTARMVIEPRPVR